MTEHRVPVRAVLFDMGGVLIDFGGSGGLPPKAEDFRGRRALLELTADSGERNAHWSESDLERRVFAPWRRQHAERYRRGREASWTPHLERLRQAYGCDLRDEELLAAWFRPYAEELEGTAHAREVVGELVNRGVVCGLVSNVPLPGAVYRPVLGAAGMGALITAYCFSYDEGLRKPSPAMLRRVLGVLSVGAGEAVMVGDRKASDVAAGKMVGTRTVWLRSQFDDGPEPDTSIDSLDRLPSLVADWNKPSGGTE